jgi:hypothetical protein
MNKYKKFHVTQLRTKNLTRTLETILAFLSALFITALLPSLLARYMYSEEQLMTSQPVLLEYIPVAAFVVAMLFLAFAVVGNFIREKLAKQLESELEMSGDDCGCNCYDSHSSMGNSEMMELENMVDKALSSKTRKDARVVGAKSSRSSSTRNKK